MKLRNILGLGTAAAALFSVVQGCGQRSAQVPLTPATPAEKQAEQQRHDRTVEAIAKARCDREQRCQNIGQNAEYASRDHCMDVMRQQASQTVGQCPKGVDTEDAKQCIGEIQGQGCGTPFAALETWVACKSDDLCLN